MSHDDLITDRNASEAQNIPLELRKVSTSPIPSANHIITRSRTSVLYTEELGIECKDVSSRDCAKQAGARTECCMCLVSTCIKIGLQ